MLQTTRDQIVERREARTLPDNAARVIALILSCAIIAGVVVLLNSLVFAAS